MSSLTKLSLEPYKGTRDFYPEEQFVQNYIFDVWRKTAESYGYLEYDSSILEETDLYRAKSGEEIVNEQTYSFVDRGGRDVTIRPEMTPTVARMVARKRKELTFPLRWFSIPNLWRYERPQRGRLREHWQLNCDLFGVEAIDADVEIISLAYDIMKAFGAKDETFEIRVNSRKILNWIFDSVLKLNEEKKHKLSKLIDKMNKMPHSEFMVAAEEIAGDSAKIMEKILSVKTIEELKSFGDFPASLDEVENIILQLKKKGIINARLEPSLMRGFDYYTGTVFEMFDINPKNPRALFGGGRYDDLVGIFGVEKVTGIGFGWGDVTTRDFLETYNLLPEYKPPVELYICHLDGFMEQANQLASDLRKQGINTASDITNRKVTAQVKTADRQKIPYVLVIGEEEIKSQQFKLKNFKTSKETTVSKNDLANLIKEHT